MACRCELKTCFEREDEQKPRKRKMQLAAVIGGELQEKRSRMMAVRTSLKIRTMRSIEFNIYSSYYVTDTVLPLL